MAELRRIDIHIQWSHRWGQASTLISLHDLMIAHRAEHKLYGNTAHKLRRIPVDNVQEEGGDDGRLSAWQRALL